MTVLLTLWVDGTEVEKLTTAIWMRPENEVLEAVFPDKEYWNKEVPSAFDFLTNEELATASARSYLERIQSHRREEIYLTGDMKTRNDVHLASSTEMRSLATGFAAEFLRVYYVGLKLQRQGKQVKVSISA